MIARVGSGWQTVLADLSLILFMVMAGAVSESPANSPSLPAARLPALAEPIAVWRAAPGSASLGDWLAADPDPRLQLTIMAPPTLAREALVLSAAAGRPARVLIEPDAVGVSAALTFDRPAALARGLQTMPAKENDR